MEASGAKEASLVGDFNSWDVKKHIMKRENKGRWGKIVTLVICYPQQFVQCVNSYVIEDWHGLKEMAPAGLCTSGKWVFFWVLVLQS